MQKVWMYLENGTSSKAKSLGATGTVVGEIVFSTLLTGHREIVSDPSYAGQSVTFTMPEIENVDVNDGDMESKICHCKGALVRNYHNDYSNYRAQNNLDNLLKGHGVLGICDIDARYLTKMLRDEGTMMTIVSTEISSKEKLAEQLAASPRIEDINYIEIVSTKEVYIHKSGSWNHAIKAYDKAVMSDRKVVAINFGVKRNILNELVQTGLEVEIIPSSFRGEDLTAKFEAKEIGGVFLLNGPGDSLTLVNEKVEIQKLINANTPVFAICLGHQLLSIAHGYNTYKLKFGQHGGNHPVSNDGVVEITAQNHNYNIPDNIVGIVDITHISLFDNTMEGAKYKSKEISPVQHHPEVSPGPHESKYTFEQFAEIVE